MRPIDADALKEWFAAQIDHYKKYSGDNCNAMVSAYGAILERIDNEPTVDAVAVRCKDCKWFQSGIDINGKPFTRCNRLVRTYGHTAPDWFCADGERKDGAE